MTLSFAALAVAFTLAPAARATHGYFAFGYSTKQKGMGGAGVALPMDSLQAAVNPAGMVFVGDRFDVGAGLYSIRPQYTVKGLPSGAPGTFGLVPGAFKGARDFILAPHGGWNHMIDPRGSVGVSIYTNGGANTRYPEDAGNGTGTFYAGDTGAKLEQLFIQPSYARMTGRRSSFGIGLPIAYQQLAARGLSRFGAFVADGTPDHLTNQGTKHSFGVGLKLGVQGDVHPNLTFGASYQTKIRVKRYAAYEDLMPKRGRVDIPATGTIGLAYHPTPGSAIALDLQKIWYSGVAGLGNPFSNIQKFRAGDPSYGLGGENGIGLGWRDVTALKLGYQDAVNETTTVRAGISYGRQPVAASEVFFNIVAPGVEEWHFTAGLTKKMKRQDELSVSVLYGPSKSVTGPNPLEAPGRQTITLKQAEVGIEVSYGKAL